jgi:hypothetical protein
MLLLHPLRPAPRLLLLAALAGLYGPAGAAIYKCEDAGGGTSYQQAPCPGGGTEAQIRPHTPSAADEEAARQRGQRDKAAADELEREQETRRREALRQSQDRRAARQAATARCAKYLEEAETLAQRGQSRSKAHDRERYERQAEDLRNRHFSECFAERR